MWARATVRCQIPIALIARGKWPGCSERPDKCNNEGDGQEDSSIAEHEASHGKHRVAAPAHGATGEMAEHCTHGATGQAEDKRPLAGKRPARMRQMRRRLRKPHRRLATARTRTQVGALAAV